MFELVKNGVVRCVSAFRGDLEALVAVLGDGWEVR